MRIRRELTFIKIENQYFHDEFYDKEGMIEGTCRKRRTFTDETGMPLPRQQQSPLSIKRTNFEILGSYADIVQYNANVQEWQEKDQREDIVASMNVHRQVLIGDGFKFIIDCATFPDGDPHCTCALEISSELNPELQNALELYTINLVRSKVMEYL